ncbi:MAG: hypothetical protein DRK00_10485 [Thermoprotei archaeon]|nr:MAG: hypothetical protein DRK00_10485 [Thermoprotei archaeon]
MRYVEPPAPSPANWGLELEDPILFVDGGEESREAEEMLKQRGLKYRRIDVRDNGLRGWLLFEYGTSKVPMLVLNNKVLVGLEEIRRALSL